MSRYTLYRGDAAPMTDITETLRVFGARVIAARPGLALIDTTEAVAAQLREALGDWKVTKEVTADVPALRSKMPPIGEQ